jgi:non-heme chloroperoxidase
MKLKSLLLAAGLALFVNASHAQDISGNWQGTLNTGQQKRLSIVKIARALDGWSGKLYNPDQGNDVGQSTPIDSITLQGQDVKLTVAAIQGRYEGKLSADGTSIDGSWTQGPQARPIVYTMVYQRATSETAWKDPSPHTSQFVTVDKDVQLEVLDWGGSGKPLVFLAGQGNSAHVFDKFAPKFTSTHHVYGISRRGSGASSVPATGYAADRLGDDVLAVLDFLKLTRPVLAGHSLGGEELSSIGSRFPDRVSGLIYLDAGYEYAFYDKARGAITIDLPELQRKLVQLGKQPAAPLIKDLLETVLPAFERSLKQTQTEFESMRPAEIAALAADPSSPVEEAIQAGFQKYTVIPAPILAIFASPHKAPQVPPNAPARMVERVAAMVAKEAAATEAQAKAFESGLPSARVIRLPGADHYIFISNETEVFREMNSFLATLP